MSALAERRPPGTASTAAPAAVTPPRGHPRFPLVDSLRAIAALSVVFIHAGGLSAVPGGIAYTTAGQFVSHAEVGVAIFFAISGFLLYRPFISVALNDARPTPVRVYLWRRFLRIVPAYWLALTALAIAPGLPGVFTGHWWIYYGFGQVYSDNYVLGGIPAAWTLAIEVTFYLLLPVYAALVSRAVRPLSRHRQAAVQLILIGLLAAGSLAYRSVLRSDTSLSWVLNALPTELDWFAPGMALAVLSAYWQGRELPRPVAFLARRPALSIGFALAAYVTVSLAERGPSLVTAFGHPVAIYSVADDLKRHVLYAAVATGLLFPAVFGEGGWVRRILSWKALAWLGLISYGIYLWHEAILDSLCEIGPGFSCNYRGAHFLGHAPLVSLFVITTVIAVICAAGSYYILERPVLRLKDLLRR